MIIQIFIFNLTIGLKLSTVSQISPVDHNMPYIFISIPLLMNKVYLSSREQLKCNFCTQWFSVQQQFAELQRYSLNACHSCFEKFKYRLTHPETYEIYDVALLKTGIFMNNRQFQLTKRIDSLIKMHHNSSSFSHAHQRTIRQFHFECEDLQADNNAYVDPINDRLSEAFRKLLDGIILNWNTILKELQKGENSFYKEKQKLIEVLNDRAYNFSTDPQQILKKQKQSEVINNLAAIVEQTKELTAESMLERLKSFLKEWTSENEHIEVKDYQSENKQNLNPNAGLQIKILQEKGRNNFISEGEDRSAARVERDKSRKLTQSKSCRKHLQLQLPEAPLKRQSSRKYLETARSQVNEKNTCVLDEYREKMSKLIKEKDCFETYMLEEPTKVEPAGDKIYGEKALIQYLVDLKVKTNITEHVCELMNCNIAKASTGCYLKSLEWKKSIKIVKLVKVHLYDSDFDVLLNWLKDKQEVHALVLTNNYLTELSVTAVLQFCSRHKDNGLRHVYFGNNYIKPSRARAIIEQSQKAKVEIYF